MSNTNKAVVADWVMGDLDYTAVSRERKRLREKIKTERGLNAALDEIGTSLMP